MSKLDNLYILASNYNISVYFFDLKDIGCLGLNIEQENMQHMIFLDNQIKQDKKLHIEILAHELGHYFTTIGNLINSPITYMDALQIHKYENKANRWSYDYLIPEKELIEAINKKNYSIDDLAEYFDVRIEFMIKRLEYLSLQKQMINLTDNKYLMLTNLPNLYIYEEIGGCNEY